MPKTFTQPLPYSGVPEILTGPSGAETQFRGFQSGAPDILSLLANSPGMNIPGLDPGQTAAMQNLITAGTSNPDLAAARAQLEALTSGPIGSSPATQAGMQAYEDIQAPQIATDSALRGTAGGGQALEASALGREAAAVPLIQQEIQNREAGVGQSMGIGQQQMQSLAMALEASGLPREVALQQAQAMFDQAQQRFQAELGLQTYPLQWVPGLTGQTSHTSMNAMDYIGAIGKGLNPASLFGG